jgi:electron transport complex protein RnfG
VRVLAHKETPGLGDKVDIKKSSWVLGFANQSKTETDPSWGVRKDGGRFDQFTCATITPRAVVNAVGRTLDYFRLHRGELLGLSDDAQQETRDNG